MTLLPAVRDELVHAAQRQLDAAAQSRRWHRLRWRRPKTSLLTIAITFALVGGSASAVAVISGVIGGSPTNDFPRVPGEEASGFVRASSPRVLGVFRIAGAAGPIELVGYRAESPRGSQLCLDLGMPDGGSAGSCAPQVPLRPREFMGFAGAGDDGPRLATGATRSAVQRVVVSYRDAGNPASTEATLTRVGTAQAQKLGSPPFTFFAAGLPGGATNVAFTGRDVKDVALWTSRFSH